MPAAGCVISTVPVGSAPVGVTVNPAGTRVYVANAVSETVSVIDTSTNTVIAVIAGFGSTPYNLVVSPDGARLYVAVNQGGFLSVVDTATNTISGNGPAGRWPFGIALNPAGTRAYITNLAVRLTELSPVFDSVGSVSVVVTVLDTTTTIAA